VSLAVRLLMVGSSASASCVEGLFLSVLVSADFSGGSGEGVSTAADYVASL